uniref:Transmembrane protein 43 n=1 Tax=Phallusia mammillata TaxID=59560 RepID=A0A6F9DUK2_9ASCI|nr:transmembrane protein 43 [Phallusia mammillata]
MTGSSKVSWTRKPTFLERVGKSLAGTVLGIAMFCISFIVLYYNEGSSVEESEMLNEARRLVVNLDSSSTSQYNDHLVFHSGFLETDKRIADNVYPVSFGCVKLKRIVEMYQWVEHTDVKEVDEIRHETTYYYETEWSSSLITSQSFAEELGHKNPRVFPLTNFEYTAHLVSIDGLQVSQPFINQIVWFETIENLPSNQKTYGHYYYNGDDSTNPKVGDYRVSFQCAGKSHLSEHGLADRVSILGLLHNGQFVPYTTKNKRTVALLYHGLKTSDEVLDLQHSYNNATTWLIRCLGFALMFVGLNIMSRIVVTIVDWVPIVRGIVALSVMMFNLSLALFLSMVTIALCWLRFHPWFASALMGTSLLPWFISLQRMSTV